MALQTAQTQLVGVVHEDDAVVDDGTHQDDEAHQGDHGQLLAGDQHTQQAAGEGQRHREQDDEGGQQALELSHHDQIDEGQGQSHPLHHLIDHHVDGGGLAVQREGAALGHLIGEGEGIQLLLQHAGLDRGVVAVQRVCRHRDVAGLVLAGDGVGGSTRRPGSNVAQRAGAGGDGAGGVHDAGGEGHVHHVFLGHRVKIIADLDFHGGAVYRDGGLRRRGGGELGGDLLVDLRNRQAIGADLVAVDVQIDGRIALAEAGGGIGEALGVVDHLDDLIAQCGNGIGVGAVDLDREAAAQLAGQVLHPADLDGAGAVLDAGNGIFQGLLHGGDPGRGQ